MRCFMDKTTEVIGRIFDTKEAVPNSFLTTIEEEMIVLQNKISDLEKKNLNLLIQNSSSQKFKSEIQNRENELASLKAELANSEKKLTSREYEIIQYKEQIQRLTSDFERLSAIAETEKKNYLSEKKKIESHAFDFVFDLSQKYKDGLSENEITLRQIRADLQKANDEVHSKEIHIKDLQNKIQILGQDYQQLLEKNEFDKKNYAEQKKKLEKQAFEFVNDNCQLEIQIINLKNELTQSQNQFEKIKQDLSIKTIDLQQAEINLSTQEKFCLELNSRILALKNEIDLARQKESESSEKQAHLEKQLEQSAQDKNLIENYKVQIENLYAEIEYAKKRYEEETGYKLKLERNKKNLALEKSLLQGALGTLRAENASLQDKIIAMSERIEHLNQDRTKQDKIIIDLENHLRDSKNQLDIEKNEVFQAQSALSRLQEEKNNLLEQFSEEKKQIDIEHLNLTQALESQINIHQEKISSLNDVISKLEERLNDVTSQKENVENTFKSVSERLSGQIADQNLALSQFAKEVALLKSSLHGEELKNFELSQKYEEKISSLTAVISKLEAQFNTVISQKDNIENTLKTVSEQLSGQIADQNLALSQFAKEVTFLESSLHDEEMKNYELNQKIDNLTSLLHQSEKIIDQNKVNYESSIAELEVKIKEQLEIQEKILIEKAHLEKLNQTQQSDIFSLQEKTNVCEETISTLQNQLMTCEKAAFLDKENLMSEIQAMSQLSSVKDQALVNTEQQLDRLTKQATQYVKFIEAERIQVKKILQHLTVEIKTAVTLHPLKDYRDATDLELRRVELELKKMPASSSQRGAIENRLEQLYIQRNQLNELINKTEKHINAFESELKKVEHRAQVLEVPAPANFKLVP